MSVRSFVVAVAIGVLFWSACSTPTEQPKKVAAPAKPIGQPIELKAPLGLPPAPIPSDNAPTAETIALGRRLYYDPQFSVDNTIACASCHTPDHGFADPGQFSKGVKGQLGGRNAPTVINTACHAMEENYA